ncbi:MAG: mandelate racemase/muconate lactonizing enzyme family protein [Oscillospiraceae bacterium]|nr:mandelate racemase/muconate lactonizing enzyme family protein [Oscillospiraceae bacterium]
MKIRSVEIFMLDGGRPGWRPVVCRVNTDEGLSGYGEASLGFDNGAAGAVGMLREIAPMVIGRDPMAHEALWDHMFSDSFWGQGGGVAVLSAVSAIDTALWDIKGKALGLPLCRLLGGPCRPRLRAYASQLQFGWGTEGMVFDRGFRREDLAEHAARAVGEGFDAVKINFITYDETGNRLGFLRGPIPLRIQRMVEARIAAVREAVGADVDILLENHGRTDAVSAAQLARIAAPYGIAFMEEPNTPMLLQTAEMIHRECAIPIAGGERMYGRWNFLNFFQKNALQVAQPDIGIAGGITEVKKICDMAHAFDVTVQAHCCGSPIIIAAALHLEAAIPNFAIHEHHVTNRSEANISLGKYDYQPVDGFCAVPELPGLGQELSEKGERTAHVHVTVDRPC